MPEHSADVVVPEIEQTEDLVHQDPYGLTDGDQETVRQTLITPMEATWLLWGKRRLIFRACWIGLVLFTLYAFLLPKKYTATTRLMPPDYNTSSMMAMALPALSGGGSGGSGGSVMGLASQLLGMNGNGDLFIGVLQSETVEDSIVNRLGLKDVYGTQYPEDTRKKLEAATTISTDKKTGMIIISVEDRSPQRASAIAQAYVQELNQALSQVNTSSAHREKIFIEERLKQVKAELDDSAKQFSVFASENSAINIPDQAKAMVEAAADLQAQLIAAESELKGLQQIFTNNNVRVRAVKARIAELQSQINKFGGKDVNPSDTSLAKGELYPSIRQLPLLGVKYLDLYRKTKIDEAVYELLTKQYEIAKIQEVREVPSAQVLDPALVPNKKSSPHRLRIMLAGLFLGFVFSGTWILGQVVWDRVDPSDSRKIFAQEVFVTIKAATWNTRFGLSFRSALQRVGRPLRFRRTRSH